MAEGGGTSTRTTLRPPPSAATILAVDDDPRVLRVLVRQLGRLGYRVLQAEDGASALRVLEAAVSIDALVTDVTMRGGMTGVDLALRAREARPGLAVVLTSGYADPELLRQQSGTVWLPKPYAAADLEGAILAALGGGAPGAGSAPAA